MGQRFARLRHRSFFIVQCSTAAAVAWWVATDLLHHQDAFFAPVTVMLCLGMSYGQRLRRVIDVTIGVAIGVLVGDIFVHFAGSGVWQIAVGGPHRDDDCGAVRAGTMLVTQAGVQSVIVTTLVVQQEYAVSRWLDAVVGAASPSWRRRSPLRPHFAGRGHRQLSSSRSSPRSSPAPPEPAPVRPGPGHRYADTGPQLRACPGRAA